MDPYARVFKAMRGEALDRIPVVLWAIGQNYSRFSAVSDATYYRDPGVMLEAQISFHREFPDTYTVPGIWPDLGSIPVASAFGCEVEFLQDGPPRITGKAIHALEQVKELEIPDPHRARYTGFVLDYLRHFKDHLPEQIQSRFNFLDGHVHLGGPVDRACLIAGYEAVFTGMKTKKALVHELLDKIVEFSYRYIEAQSAIVGDVKRITMSDHIAGMTGEDEFLEFILPAYNRIFDFSGAGIRIYHNENNWNHLMRHMRHIRCDVIHAGPELDWTGANRYLHQCIMGNLDPLGVLLDGGREQIESAVLGILEDAGRSTRLWFSTGGGMAPGTPKRKVRAMVRAVERYGVLQ